ncbi:hypothetical protein ACFXPA_16510 [Amycolatopsis sp. NPDC059090]|uniref:hypothetical protein n=1 Tax=Amycolatopsis sp. NPDC059090 TaxID=3346723 RepID=UPI00366EC8DE
MTAVQANFFQVLDRGGLGEVQLGDAVAEIGEQRLQLLVGKRDLVVVVRTYSPQLGAGPDRCPDVVVA